MHAFYNNGNAILVVDNIPLFISCFISSYFSFSFLQIVCAVIFIRSVIFHFRHRVVIFKLNAMYIPYFLNLAG